jgi:EmrB/QacA subfamily drug resistance transporter
MRRKGKGNKERQTTNPLKGEMIMRIKTPEYKWRIFAVTSLANITSAFAITSLNLAMPVMAADFGVSMGAISWLSLVYSFIPSCILLIFGRLADLYGYKRQFVGGFFVFGLASLLLPLLARNLAALIFFRCFQAVGYGMMISITQAMCNRSFPPQERGKALGINAVSVSVGFSIGPTIGGVLLTHFSWRSIFYFNIPFCLLGILASVLVLKKDEPHLGGSRRMDWPGSLFFAAFIGFLALAINFSADWGLTSPRFIACLLISAGALALFIFRESHTEAPLMELGFFRSRAFTLANAASVFSYMLQQMTTFLTPFFLMNILLIAKGEAGLVMLANPLSMVILSPVGGKMTDLYGSRRPALLGLSFIALGCILMSLLTLEAGVGYIVIVLLCYGVGGSLSVSAINAAVFGSVPRERSGVVSGMVATMRNLGQGLGVAFGGAIMAMRQSRYIAAGLEPGNQVYLLAQRDVFYFGLGMVAAAICCMLLIPLGRKREAGA